MRKYEEKILNTLLDQYERSKSFIGTNGRNQSFQKKVVDLVPGYDDSAKYDLFRAVNDQIAYLEERGVIEAKRLKRGKFETEVISSIKLITEKIDECYYLLGRTPKADLNSELIELLMQYRGKTPLLSTFCDEQLKRLAENKKVQHFDEVDKFEQVLKALAEVESVEEETFVRNFSIRVLGDSKAFDKIKNTVVSILLEYGEYPDKETVLSDLNIVRNPGYVYVKGKGCITISGQTLDIGKLDGDIGLSSKTLDDIEDIHVSASKVVTIENLTTYHSYIDEDAFVLYLGGYHNSIRRKMIRKLYENNPDMKYYHYGDIDAGGFYILIDLRKKTGIPFKAMNMDVSTLMKYEHYTKKLTENDRIRLQRLKDSEFKEVIEYMLENNCKLEQEALGL